MPNLGAGTEQSTGMPLRSAGAKMTRKALSDWAGIGSEMYMQGSKVMETLSQVSSGHRTSDRNWKRGARKQKAGREGFSAEPGGRATSRREWKYIATTINGATAYLALKQVDNDRLVATEVALPRLGGHHGVVAPVALNVLHVRLVVDPVEILVQSVKEKGHQLLCDEWGGWH